MLNSEEEISQFKKLINFKTHHKNQKILDHLLF